MLQESRFTLESLSDSMKETMQEQEENFCEKSKNDDKLLSSSKGLESSLDLEKGLEKQWYAIAFASYFRKKKQLNFDLLDKSWVVVQSGHTYKCVSKDLFTAVGDQIFEFDKEVNGEVLQCVLKHDMLWVCGDWSLDEKSIPDVQVPDGFNMHAEIEVEVPVEHGLLMENLLDLAHAPFTHTSTFAKGWPIPDIVKFHTYKLLGGDWDPYPIDMSFEPPCMVLSTIGLASPGKIMRGLKAKQCERHLHQLHVCLPSRRGHTRLLYRMSLDFMGWLRGVPMIQELWKQVASQVLGEDLVLVLGQQDRLIRGGNTWANPVSYDKLAVRYRRWRNSLKQGEVPVPGRISIDAGQLFRLDENDD
eukprot:TRINITY_DN4405_c0_g1_i1.p1 TRINITY_DN4405_c0_g1~~TRINITY_DN4405_c0_g1_i1.p1  ORF type:complete len:360 (-),score=50.22 TRINITY_DN4405_c0_g1_i1:206-1285(-)